MLNDILENFDLVAKDYHIKKFGGGLINGTWKVAGSQGDALFILQQINKNVFKHPQDIADNISKIGDYLHQNYPNYLFVTPLPTKDGKYILKYDDDEYYRLFPYVKDSITIDTVTSPSEAYEAAKQFAKFTHLLADFDTDHLAFTLSGFHDLSFRFKQFQQAVKSSGRERLLNAEAFINKAHLNKDIANMYDDLVNNQLIPFRVIHHDTKISNILFNEAGKGLCVIDLDTVMPGYYISDIGDMMRTYLPACNEEEQDLSKIEVREDFFAAIVDGYFSEMGSVLTVMEKKLFVYAGKFMIYMQALRFLTDYLNNDSYYQTSYPDQNLIRAKNQFTLLASYQTAEVRFQEIIDGYH